MSGPMRDGRRMKDGRAPSDASSGRKRRAIGWALAGAALAVVGCTDGRAPEPAGTVRTSAALRGAFMHGQVKGDSGAAPSKAATATATPAAGLLAYFGGRVVSNIQVVQVMYGTGSYLPQVTTDIGGFYQGVLNSGYVDWLSEYNTTGLPAPTTNQTIGRGSFSTQVTISLFVSYKGTTLYDTNIQAELAAQIQAGTLPAPTKDAGGNNNTYYAIFFPHGKTITEQGAASCQVFCAYHGTVANVPGFGEIYYGVHPDFQSGSGCEFGCGAAPTAFGNVTQVASHELVETITDAEVGLAQTFGPPLAWYDESDNLEIGDICNDQHATVVGGNGTTYDVQTEYSNTAGACVATRSPSLSVSPTSFEGGASVTGLVNLLTAATTATTVTLTSSAPSLVTVPASVVIAAGSSTATFPVTSVQTTTQTSVTVTATFPGTPPTTSAATVTVLASPTVSSLTLAPTAVTGGASSTATVTLSGPAPAGGASVTLASTNPSVASVPATLSIAQGASTGTFTVTTTVQTFTAAASISASYHNTTQSALLAVTPATALTSVSVAPATIEGGGTATVTVAINNPAPAGGAVVTLASTNTTLAPVPASVTVPAGQVFTTFPVVTTAAASATAVTITGTFPATVTRTASLTIVPSPTPTALTLNPTSVPGGTSSTGTVTLSRAAPAGGVTVALSSTNAAIASVPATLAVPAGATSGTFAITTSATSVNVTSTISATLNTLTATATLNVTKVLAIGNATYDPALKVPRCKTAGAFCDTGGLIDGRGSMSGGVEQNTPNTVASSCLDGSGGSYHSDESIDGLKVSTTDGTNLAPGKSIKIDTTVWVFSSSDHLDLYLTTDATASSPVWTLLNATTITPTTSGAAVLSFTTTLPATGGMTWAVRANFRFGGATALCTTGSFDDHDDVAFLIDTGSPPPNQPPVVNAGPDLTVTLPATATLAGAVSDDGLPNPPGAVTVTWSTVSGPGTVTFGNASLAATTATFSAAGTYVLRLGATDSVLSASDDVTVTVNPQPVNQPPVVNAGPDQTITLPSSASLSGTATDDGLPNPPGTLTTTWTKVSGPGTVTFGNAGARATTAAFSAAGSYVLRLTASDSVLSASDDVAITVNTQVNTAPVVNAGPDQTITLPSTASLSGTVTDDGLPNPPGTVTTTWTKVSGPGTVTFASVSARATTATFSAAGSYVLRLTASDSVLSGSDDIAVTVNTASGNNPCAGLCTNPVNITVNGSYQSGNIGTGAVCLQTTSKVHGGNCGNFVSPRTLKVNGVTESCTGANWSSVPAAHNGGYCVQTTSGNQPWAFITLF